MIRKSIVEKINLIHEEPNLHFNQEEVEYMVARYLESHSKCKVESVMIHRHADDDAVIVLNATLDPNYEQYR
jgi:hypothetical protein